MQKLEMNMTSKEQFYHILNDIKQKHPSLKIRLYKAATLPNGDLGGYMDNKIMMAIGGKNQLGQIAWKENILTLCHEYAHYLRDLKNPKYQNWIGCLNHYIEQKQSFADRVQMASYIALDEYTTDTQSVKILKKYGVKFSKRDFWRNAHSYALKIKMSPWTKQYVGENKVPLSFTKSKKISYKEIFKPLTRSEYCKMLNLLKNKQLKRIGKKWK